MPENPITTISQALTMPAKMPILRIQGKLTKLVPEAKARRVEGTYGIVFYQDAQLVGPDGREIIKVSFGLESPLSDTLNNQLVELACFNSEKHGWVGVMSDDNTYKDKTTRQIKVTKTGIINLMSEPPASSTAKPQARAAQPTARPPQQQTNATDPVKEIQRRARRITTVMDTCLTCAGWLADKHNLRPEDVRAIGNTMFIELKATTDFNALPAYDPRKQEAAPPPPAKAPEPEPPAPTPPPQGSQCTICGEAGHVASECIMDDVPF